MKKWMKILFSPSPDLEIMTSQKFLLSVGFVWPLDSACYLSFLAHNFDVNDGVYVFLICQVMQDAFRVK